MNDPAHSSDEELLESLSPSEEHALAALAGRYAQSVYDFALRATLDLEAAASITVACFEYLRANAAERPAGLSPRAWLFGFALERVLETTGDRNRGEKLTSGDRRFTQPGPGIDREVALWAWQAARSLRPRDYCLVDLTLRREVASEELPESASGRGGVRNALERARDAFEEAYIATALYFRGRDACGELSGLIGGSGAAIRVGIRRQIASHVEACDSCKATLRTLPLPADVFTSLRPVDPPPELPDQILDAARAQAALATGQLSLDGVGDSTEVAEEDEDEHETEVGQAEEVAAEPASEPDRVPEDEFWARPADEPAVPAAPQNLEGVMAELEARLGVEGERPYEDQVYAEYGSGYEDESAYGYEPADGHSLSLRERLDAWFRPSDGSRFLWSYALVGVSTALAVYLGIAFADALRGGGGDAGAVPLGSNGVLREIACDAGPFTLEHGSVKVYEFDPEALRGFRLESVLIVERPNEAPASALEAEVEGASALVVRSESIPSDTPRTDEYRLQLAWERDDDGGVSECAVLVNVTPS